MKMMKLRNILCACAFLIGTCVHAYAADPGKYCSTAIPLADGYTEPIDRAKTVWYSAWTFDLPLAVYFVPQNGPSDPKPEVEMDFSCQSGVYGDSIICNLFCKNSGSGIQIDLPHKPQLLTGQTDEGYFCYYIAIGKEYRDLLLQAGISYNVEVFVKVTYKSAGTITIAPDDMFTSCMDSAKFMHLGDTVRVKPLDKERHVVVPYVQWQEDSIRYVWNGTASVEVAVGNDCDYDPTDGTNEHRLDYFVLQPQDTMKMTRDEVKYYIHGEGVTSEAGMFFAKFYTSGSGVMKIERVPQAPPEGGATLLRYDKITSIPADTDALYAIPYTWDTATIFTTPTDHVFKMYIGTTPDFTLPEAICTYQFHKNDNGHWLGVPDAEMKALWEGVTAKYLYVRFECTAKTTLKPAIWNASSCMDYQEIKWPGATLTVEKGSYGAVYYRFYYNEWKDGTMTFKWLNNDVKCPTYIGNGCDFPISNNPSSMSNLVVAYKSIDKNGSWTRTPAQMVQKDWAGNVDEAGYLYIRFDPSNSGTMKISTSSPAEQDPVEETYPIASIAAICGEKSAAGQIYSVRVSHDQTLSLFAGEITDISGLTPVETWSQTTSETHELTLAPGVYTLHGDVENLVLNVE